MELTVQKLLSQNISEALIDKQPRQKRDEILANVAPRHRVDPTMAAVQYQKIMREEQEEGEPVYRKGETRAVGSSRGVGAAAGVKCAPAACRERVVTWL